jgi:hypothetical protein
MGLYDGPPMPSMTVRRALLALLAVALAACGPTASLAPVGTPVASSASPAPSASSPTPAASVDAASVYAAIAAQVEQIRGLEPTAAIAPVLLDADQLRANLTASFDKDNPPTAIRETEALYQLLGLMPSGSSLRSTELDLLSGQVAGYYSSDDKALFVVSRAGGIGPSQKVTYAHEFTHELQDQNFDLNKVRGSATDQSDESLARLTLIEGDAVTVQTTWTTANLTATDLAQLLADATDPAVIQSLEQAPRILRILSLAPYTEGQAFIAALQARGGEAAVNAAFANPPDSTSQVLHPELFGRRSVPAAVKLPRGLFAALPSGWRSLGQDTMGELFIRSWLQARGLGASLAMTVASGWAGDRIEVFDGPNGTAAVVIVLRWSSSAAADAFTSAWNEGFTSPPFAAAARFDSHLSSETVGIVLGSSQPAVDLLDAALHRP